MFPIIGKYFLQRGKTKMPKLFGKLFETNFSLNSHEGAFGNVIVCIDGCVYNRKDFGNYNSDSELISDLYKKFGFENTIKKLNGDFAISLYDKNNRTLHLARDRFGVKPLYYVNTDFFAFASRPSLLLDPPNVSKEVNNKFVAIFAASHYRYFDNDPETTPYKEISMLPPANILEIREGKIKKKNYWSLEESGDFDLSEKELAEQYKTLLLNAVMLRFNNAKNPVFTLSGGMDSSSVLALAVFSSCKKQHAISSVYDDKTYDESEEIQSMLETKVKTWHKVEVDNIDVFSLINNMIRANEEPVATATWLSHYLLCERAKELGFQSVFGGLGGDELNAGEYEHYLYHFADLRVSGKEKELTNEVKNWIKYHNHPVFKKSFEIMEENLKKLADIKKQGKCLPDLGRLYRYASVLNPDFFDLKNFKPTMEHPFNGYLKNRTYQDLTRETIPCCLRAEDRQTSTFGLDNFLPFLDYRLVEFMFKIPGTLKFRNGISKYLLRETMKGILPEETRTRIKKTGWNAPAHLWFSQGEGYENLVDLVNSKEFKERGIYDLTVVNKIIREHKEIVDSGENKENHMMFLWQLVNLELWLRDIKQSELVK